MTSTATETPQVNGAAPAAAEEDAGAGGCEECVTTGAERIMGIVGIAFAAGLLFVGLDLATGGKLSHALSGGKNDDDAGAR